MNPPRHQAAITNTTLSSQVQERIRQLIIHRELHPGSRIDQNKLAETLRVSLVPVREALKALEAEGLVTIYPRRGAFVTEVSLEHLDDLYFARSLIEGEAIFHAIPCLTEVDMAHLRALVGQMVQATDSHDIKQFMELNREFHMTIYRTLHNEHLLQAIVNLWERSELYRFRYMFIIDNADIVHQEHREILAACEAGDAAEAKQLAKRHIQRTHDGLKEKLLEEL